MTQPYKQCPRCGTIADLHAASCAHCGRQYRTQFQSAPQPTQMFVPPASAPPVIQPPPAQNPIGTQSAAAAILLSLLLPGAGQMYNRQMWKGAICLAAGPGLLVLSAVLFFTGILLHPALWLVIPILWFLIPVTWFAQVIDAAIIAGRLNRGEIVGEMQFF